MTRQLRLLFHPLVLILPLCGAGQAAAADERVLASPDGKVRFSVLAEGPRLQFAVTLQGKPVIASSPLALSVDGVTRTDNAKVLGAEAYQVDDPYPTRGVHSRAVNRCNGTKLSLQHGASGAPFTLEVRTFNDGVAYRLVVPGDGPRVPDETSTFTLPAGSVVWYHGFRGHYEGKHVRKALADVKAEEWAAPPLTFKLPDGAGYAAITEADLVNYPGMGLQADGQGNFRIVLGPKQPVSYPFELRFKENIERLSKPAAITGPIVTPWRVVLVGADLNTLVNSDILTSLDFHGGEKLELTVPCHSQERWKTGGSVLHGVSSTWY